MGSPNRWAILALIAVAQLGVDCTEAGVASAMVNTSQQVGGAVGTARRPSPSPRCYLASA